MQATHCLRRQLVAASTKRPCNDPASRALRCLHQSPNNFSLRKRNFFTSNAALQQQNSQQNSSQNFSQNSDSKSTQQNHKRKPNRQPPGKTSLRRVAVEAQRSRANVDRHTEKATPVQDGSAKVTAICVADQFDMEEVMRILRAHGFTIDPHKTDFLPEQVVHARGANNGDIFVFPSGSLVAWSLEEDIVTDLATKILLPAAIIPQIDQLEMEYMEFREDPSRDTSAIKGDVIYLGTKSDHPSEDKSGGNVDSTLTKIAFSSGLARSTKLAVLETMLQDYFDSTRNIPKELSRGHRLPFNQSFVLQKTGELLHLRAQLNHYSELTDSLPDLFWDSRHELGLEDVYDQVSMALDVNVRIKTLNEKMTYAQEIASILREVMGANHSSRLEWIIIILITIEVGFGIRQIYNEIKEEEAKSETAL